MTASPLRLGLVGCGRLAEAGYLPALELTPDVRLVAVADTDADRRNLVAARSGADAFPDAATLVERAAVDVVVLATPAAAHVADAATVTARGVPVLVEKPPAADTAGAAALDALRPAPWVGFNRRFDPGVAAARALVPDRGDLRLALAITYRRGGWGALTVRDDALVDLGPHVIDLARWLSSSEVLAVSGADVGPERATFELTLERAHARVTVATDRPHRELVEVRSAGGRRLYARHRLGGLVAAVGGRLRPQPGPPALVASLAGQLTALAAAARGEAAPALGSASDGVAVMVVLDSVRTSAASGGRAVAVPPLH